MLTWAPGKVPEGRVRLLDTWAREQTTWHVKVFRYVDPRAMEGMRTWGIWGAKGSDLGTLQKRGRLPTYGHCTEEHRTWVEGTCGHSIGVELAEVACLARKGKVV